MDFTKLPTPGVIAIVKNDETSRFITNGVTFSPSRIFEYAIEKNLIVFNSAESTLINFSHNVMSDSEEGIGRNIGIKLSITDPEDKFESNLMGLCFRSLGVKNVVEEVNRLRSLRPSTESTELQELRKAFVSKEQDINRLLAGIGFVSIKEERSLPRLERERDELAEKIRLQIISDNRDFFSKINRELEALDTKASPGVYFFYGIGGNYDSWAGPVDVILKGVNYKYDGTNSVRVLELEYHSTDAILNTMGETFVYTGLGATVESKPFTLNRAEGLFTFNSLHLGVTYCLKTFLANAANIGDYEDNVLVFFPDLTVALKDFYSSNVSSIKNTIIERMYDLGFLERSVKYLNSLVTTPTDPNTTARAIQVKGEDLALEQTYRALGLDIIASSLTRSTQDPIISLHKPPYESIENVLNIVTNAINDKSNINISRINLFYESDPTIRQLYEQYYPFLRKYSKDKPLLIFGDHNFILQYFYGFKESTVIPINKSDDWLTNVERVNKIQAYITKPNVSDGVFDKLFYKLPDEYAFSEKSKNVVLSSIPLFLNGFENSNVLDFNLTWQGQYYAELAAALRPGLAETTNLTQAGNQFVETKLRELSRITNQKSKSGEDASKALTERNVRDFLDTLKVYGTITSKKDRTYVKQLFLSYFPNLSEEFAEEFLTEIISVIQNSGGGRTLIYDEFVSNALLVKITRFIEKIKNAALFCNLRCLPLFKFNQIAHTLQFPAIFLSREAQVVGSLKDPFISRLISGEWRIVGFSHVIEEAECYSQFTLVRAPLSSATYSIIKKKEDYAYRTSRGL